jgi:hypothetical protein
MADLFLGVPHCLQQHLLERHCQYATIGQTAAAYYFCSVHMHVIIMPRNIINSIVLNYCTIKWFVVVSYADDLATVYTIAASQTEIVSFKLSTCAAGTVQVSLHYIVGHQHLI